MTRKHFEQLAGVILEALSRESLDSYTVGAVARILAGSCQTVNSRFDFARFYVACGLTEKGTVITETEGTV